MPRGFVEIKFQTFINLGAKCSRVINTKPRSLYLREIKAVPIVQDTVWASGPVRAGKGNVNSTGVRAPNRPGHSELLYRLCLQAWDVRMCSKVCKYQITLCVVSNVFRPTELTCFLVGWLWVKGMYALCLRLTSPTVVLHENKNSIWNHVTSKICKTFNVQNISKND